MLRSIFLFMALLCGSACANDRFHFSGYGSFVGGKVISGDIDPSGEKEFQVDFYDYAFYTGQFDVG